MEHKKHPERRFYHWLSIPFIYGMIFPLIILDAFISVYHQVCFRLYGLPLLDRKNYIRMDRHNLAYLNWLDKLNCDYCSYAVGIFSYSSAIAAETEKYWCGIKHDQYEGFVEPKHQKGFLPYDDKNAFNRKYPKQSKQTEKDRCKLSKQK